MTIPTGENMVAVRALALVPSIPVVPNVPRDKTPRVTIVASKCAPRSRTSVCVGPMEDVSVEENHVTRFRGARDLRVALCHTGELVHVCVLHRCCLIVEDVSERTRGVSEFIIGLGVEWF